MAKVRQTKSLQELLQEAVIPNYQAPFSIPDNWCWVNLKMLVKHRAGNSKLIKGKLSSIGGDGLYRAYSASGQDVFYKNYDYQGKAVIVSAVGARCGKAFLADEKWSAIANTHIIFPNGLNCKFLFYVLNNEDWWIKSGSAQPFVVVNESLERPFMLPPLLEQKRIVDKIEYLFSKLDEAKELIQKSLDEFEDRKSAILHKAFNGELVSFRKPERVTISEVSRINPKTKKIICNDNEMVSFVPMRAVSETSGKIKEVLFEKYEKVKKGFTYFEQGDVLFAKITPCMENGKCFIADDLKGGFGFASTEFYVFKISPKILNKYLWYILRHKTFRDNASHVMTGAVGQQRVPKQYLENCIITLPARGEQQEVVNILDSFFEKDDKSKALLDIIDQIEEMKKSILSRAFRGELGTHSDNDEPAIELVKKILSNN